MQKARKVIETDEGMSKHMARKQSISKIWPVTAFTHVLTRTIESGKSCCSFVRFESGL